MEYTGAQLEYLEHLGIDVWVTRESLLNEATVAENVVQQEAANQPPPVQSVPVQAVPAQTVSTQPMSHGAQSAAPISAPASVQTTAAPVNVGSPMSAAPAFPVADPINPQVASQTANGSQGELQAPPVFNIQFWCYSTGIWLVSGNVNLAPEHHKLVHNIAQFVQTKKRKPKHVGIFSWPMLDSPNIDQGPEVASKHLKDHIHRLQEVSSVKKVVAFSDCDDWFEHLNPVKLSFTLDEVLNNPENKKALWQQLIPHQISD